MNDARMTIRLPGASLAFARRYADEMGVTVTDLVVRYFDRMREVLSGRGIPSSVRDVAGIMPSSTDERSVYRDHLLEKYA